MIISMPPGTGDARLTIARRALARVMVSTPADRADRRPGLAMFQEADVPVLGVIKNVGSSSARIPRRGMCLRVGGARRKAAPASAPEFFFGRGAARPGDPRNLQRRPPITVSQPKSPYAQTFRDIAAGVWKEPGETAVRRAPPRIVVRRRPRRSDARAALAFAAMCAVGAS